MDQIHSMRMVARVVEAGRFGTQIRSVGGSMSRAAPAKRVIGPPT